MDPPVPMGLYNILENPGAGEIYDIPGTPTVKFFYNGKKVEDHRGWSAEWIVNNVRSWVRGIQRNPNKYDNIPDPKPINPNLYKPINPYNKEYNKMAIDGHNMYRSWH